MKLILAIFATAAAAVVMAQPAQVKPSSAELKKLQSLEKGYNVTKAALAKKPKDSTTRKAFVKAAVLFGHESMVGPVLPAKVKYRQALRVYREVLKLDPRNEVAKKESDLIIKIYKSMGRPVPDN